jgi:serine/threonine-protein kinase SRPK3
MSLEDVHLQRILEHIGPFPSGFLQTCQHRNDFFDEQGIISQYPNKQILIIYQGSLLRTHDLFPSAIEQCLRAYKVMDEKQIPPAATFIRRCLTIDPRERPTSLELLNDDWLKDA